MNDTNDDITLSQHCYIVLNDDQKHEDQLLLVPYAYNSQGQSLQ